MLRLEAPEDVWDVHGQDGCGETKVEEGIVVLAVLLVATGCDP